MSDVSACRTETFPASICRGGKKVPIHFVSFSNNIREARARSNVGNPFAKAWTAFRRCCVVGSTFLLRMHALRVTECTKNLGSFAGLRLRV
jgi:hypothetical protein